jgi:hypothetical protein
LDAAALASPSTRPIHGRKGEHFSPTGVALRVRARPPRAATCVALDAWVFYLHLLPLRR